jgi:hypothetical protein
MQQAIHRNRIQMRQLLAAEMPEPLHETEMLPAGETVEDKRSRLACRMP